MKAKLFFILSSVFFTFFIAAQYQNLNQPVHLKQGNNKIILQDFYLNYENVSEANLLLSGNNLNISGNEINLNNSSLNSFIDFVALKINNQKQLIPIYKNNQQSINFSYETNLQTCNKMAILGDFNNWNSTKNELKKRRNSWETNLMLSEGSYNYHLICDGKKIYDETNNNKIADGFGGFYNVLKVKNEREKPFISTSQILAETAVSKVRSIRNNTAKNNSVSKTSKDSPTKGNPAKTRINIKIENSNKTQIVALWNNELILSKTVENTEYVQLVVPFTSKNVKRSFIRVFAFNENGKANDLLIPLSFGTVIKDTKKLKRQDLHNNIIYSALVDRFENGSRRNDFALNNVNVDKNENYFGGDLQGLINKYEEGYFEKLGINTLAISPIMDNANEAHKKFNNADKYHTAYLGNWTMNHLKVDKHFGTSQDFKKLVEVVHKKNNNIILDFVSNNVHKNSEMIQQNPSWKTSLTLPNNEKNIQLFNGETKFTTWFEMFLPSLNFSKKEVVNQMVDKTYYWLNVYNIDGFKHLDSKNIQNNYWRALTKKIKKNFKNGNNNVFQIGESFGDGNLFENNLGTGLLNSKFNYQLYSNLENVLLSDNESFVKVAESLTETLNVFGNNNLICNTTGSKNLQRFINEANNTFEKSVAYKKLSLLHAFNIAIPGVPNFYYGDEIGLENEHEPMKFENLNYNQEEVKNNLTKLLTIRKYNISLIYGSTKILFADEDALVIERKYFDKIAIIALNKSNIEKEIFVTLSDNYNKNLSSNFNTISGNDKSDVYFSLPANGFEILISK